MRLANLKLPAELGSLDPQHGTGDPPRNLSERWLHPWLPIEFAALIEVIVTARDGLGALGGDSG
jgi:hypothetical protein